MEDKTKPIFPDIQQVSGDSTDGQDTPRHEMRSGKPFRGAQAHLDTMPPWRGGLTADEIIRADRDSRP
jgi:hypothetical protein